MAAEKTTDYNSQPNAGDDRRGGTQPGEPSRQVGPENKAGGTPNIAAPSGGDSPPSPARAVPNTDLGKQRP